MSFRGNFLHLGGPYGSGISAGRCTLPIGPDTVLSKTNFTKEAINDVNQ